MGLVARSRVRGVFLYTAAMVITPSAAATSFAATVLDADRSLSRRAHIPVKVCRTTRYAGIGSIDVPSSGCQVVTTVPFQVPLTSGTWATYLRTRGHRHAHLSNTTAMTRRIPGTEAKSRSPLSETPCPLNHKIANHRTAAIHRAIQSGRLFTI